MSAYFDTSSLVKIYHREEGTPEALKFYHSSETILLSELSQLEFLSSISHRYRRGEIHLPTLHALIDQFQDDLNKRYSLVPFSSLVVTEAWNLLRQFAEKYNLRTLNSLQFAFFKVYGDVDTLFVCSDSTLKTLVEEEGFKVSFL